MADPFVLAVVGLPELGQLLEDGKPEGVDVVTVAGGPGADRRLAQAVRGATRDDLLCVVADTGDETTNRLPGRLARGGVRVVALTGLAGADGHVAAHPNLRALAAPFTVDDVLAELSALPGDVPFFLPVAGGDRLFGDAGGPEPGRQPDLFDVIVGRDGGDPDVAGPPEPGEGWGAASDLGGGVAGERAREAGGPGDAGDGAADDPLGDYVTHAAPALDALPAWARIPTPPRPGAPPDPVPGWLPGPGGHGAAPEPLPAPMAGTHVGTGPAPEVAPGWLAGGPGAPGPLSDYAARALHDPPVVGTPLPARPAAAGPVRSAVLAVCSYKGGSGKCLTGDALVTDPVSGVPRRLDEVVHDPGHTSVLTLDGDTVRPAPITAKVDSGVQPTLQVALRSGRSVTATPHHPLLTAGGWCRADRVVPGEAVAVPARLPLPERPCRLAEPDLARLTASVVGGCARAGATMPVAAFRLPGDQLARLVGAVWAGAGRGAGDGPPAVTMASARLARALQHLLLRLGIQSAVAPAGAVPVTGTGGAAAAGRPAGAPGPPGEGTRPGPWRLAVHRSGVAGLAAATLRGEPGSAPAARAGGDVFWDEVVAVAPAGERQVWDLSVEPTRCFVANDVVVHNTSTAMMAAGALARAAAPAGKRVALVDANTAQSSISTILRQPPRGTILDLVRTDVDGDLLAGALTPAPEVGPLDVLFGAPDLRRADGRLVTPALYRRVVAGLRRTHDYVVVDTPVAEAVGHDLFDDFVLRDADRVIVVVDPNRETIENNVEWLDIIGDPVSAGGRNFPPERIGIVLNRAEESLDWDAEAVGRYFRRYQFLGAVPRSPAVQRASDDGRLLHAFDSAVERAMRGVLAHLVDEPALAPEPAAGRSGLERILARLFAGRGAR